VKLDKGKEKILKTGEANLKHTYHEKVVQSNRNKK
jgi:hypothetical protein